MKLVDMPVLGTGALRRVGSSPTEGINLTICKLPVLITIAMHNNCIYFLWFITWHLFLQLKPIVTL